MTVKKTILICDVNIKKRGHYIGYNQYILDNFKEVERMSPELNFIFLYNSEAKSLLNIRLEIADKVHFLQNHHKDSFLNRIKTVQETGKFVKQHKVVSMIFMDLDKYQLAIALTRLSCTISGVLFRPHHRITASNNSSGFSTFLKRLKKITAERILLSNKKINRILILNDQEGVDMLNKKYGTGVFHYLPDPIFRYGQPENKTAENGKNASFIFLLFGALNERKNITNIIKAYELAEFPYPTKLLIIGPGEVSYLNHLNELTNNLQTLKNGNKNIEIKNEFVTDQEMEYYFSISDACLLIYKNFYGSSGLLGRAAVHNLKVIGPNVGLLNQMITQNKIGLTCDPENCEAISDSLQTIHDFAVPESNFKQFYQDYSPEQFLKVLLTHNLLTA